MVVTSLQTSKTLGLDCSKKSQYFQFPGGVCLVKMLKFQFSLMFAYAFVCFHLRSRIARASYSQLEALPLTNIIARTSSIYESRGVVKLKYHLELDDKGW